MKTCFKCGQSKPIDEFYPHPQMGDGHLNKCKACTKADVSARYERLIATREGRLAERARGRDKYRRLYVNAPRKAKSPNIWRTWVARHPAKHRAHNLVGNAIRDGRLQRRPCEVCGSPKTDAHHDDYEKPLEVRWLCRTHHADHHRIERERVA